MGSTKKELLVENLLIAGAAGLLAFLVAAASFLVTANDVARERAALSDLAGRPITAAPVRIDDPAILRLYRIQGQGPQLYGAALALESRRGTALAVALVAANGELQAVSLMDANSSRSPFTRVGWFADDLGKGGETPFPSDLGGVRSPAVLSGATESFFLTSTVFERLSKAVRAISKEGQ